MMSDPAKAIPPFYKNWRCVLGLSVVMGVNVIWEILNEVPAIWDMAYHQLMGISYLEALRQGTLISEFATLSPAYPPLYYLHEAGVYLLLPESDFRTLIVNFPYILLTAYATYRISGYFLSASTAGWASVLVLLFPAMAMVHREALLDGALAAWVTTGAWLILRSRWFTHIGWTLLFGLVCGLGAMTKWTFPIYLVIPVLFGVIASKQPLRSLRNLVVAGLLALTVMVPYYLQNLASMVSRYPTTDQAGLIPWRPYPRHGEPGLDNIWGWIYYPRVLASYFLYLPLTVLFGVGLVGNAFHVPRFWRRDGFRCWQSSPLSVELASGWAGAADFPDTQRSEIRPACCAARGHAASPFLGKQASPDPLDSGDCSDPVLDLFVAPFWACQDCPFRNEGRSRFPEPAEGVGSLCQPLFSPGRPAPDRELEAG